MRWGHDEVDRAEADRAHQNSRPGRGRDRERSRGPGQESTAGPDDPRTGADAPRIGRIPVLDVGPVVDRGTWPAKAVIGEFVPITATVFREGHDSVAATAVLLDPDGAEHARARMRLLGPGLDRYGTDLAPDREGEWTFRVEAWSDPYGTWEHDAVIKVDAGVDVDLMLEEGARLMERAIAAGCGATQDDVQVLRDATTGLRDGGRPAQARLAAGVAPAVEAVLAATPLREMVTASPTYRLTVQRKLALFSSWYELFPRSEGAHQVETDSGLRWVRAPRQAAERLPAIADLGFDVLYLPPIHPIGTTHRKGPNNVTTARPETTRACPGRSAPRPAGTRRCTRTSAPSTTFGRYGGRPASAGSGGRAGHRVPGVAGPSVGEGAPGVVPAAAGRHDPVRGEPAEALRGHLPVRLRVGGLARPVDGTRRGRPLLDRPGRAHLPRGQPAHQAASRSGSG